MDHRPSIDEWAMKLCEVVAQRGTCHRRLVGCVLTDSRGRVLATGYNGVASGTQHCRGVSGIRCAGAFAASGQNMDGCEAVHAEQNALLQCKDPDKIFTCYTYSCSPCMNCLKLLLNSGCERLVFHEVYDQRVLDLWTKTGRSYEILQLPSQKGN